MKKYLLLLVVIIVSSLFAGISPASSQNQCAPKWQCSEWSECANSQTTRSCVDLNNCNSAFHPPEIKSCTPQKTCEYDWQPTEWSPSCDYQCTQTRSYVNKGTCGGTSGKPLDESRLFTPACKDSDYTLETSRTVCSKGGELSVGFKANKICIGSDTITKSESCTPSCQSDDFNYSEWSVCLQNGKKTRTYTKKISCTGEPFKSDIELACKPSCLLSDFKFNVSNECQVSGYKQVSWIKSSSRDCDFSSKDGKLYGGNNVLSELKESCTYIKPCDVSDWKSSELTLSCDPNCEYERLWENSVSCLGSIGKPSDVTRLHSEAIRKKGYFIQSLEITDNISAIAMGNALLIPGGKSGEVLVDYMELVVKDVSGKETVIARDDFNSGTVPFGGSWKISDWFKTKVNNQSIFYVKDGNLVAPVSKYPNEVLHPWGTQWPRITIPLGSKTIEMRARIKATGDAAWQWGLDFYKNSTTEFPITEGGISDWYFAEHDWIDVVVGPIDLVVQACKDFDYILESSGLCQPDGLLKQTYTKQGSCEGDQKITKDISCDYVRPCTSDDWEYTISPSDCPLNEKQTKTYSKKSGVICEGQKPDETISCINPYPETSAIPNQVWDEDTTKIIDLTKYFSDSGSLTFVASFIQNIFVQITNGIASLIPKNDFNGNATLIFTATNEKGKSVSSNEITLNIHPLAETEGSIITSSQVSEDSFVLLSSVDSSVIEKSSVGLSSSSRSSIKYANVSNSEIIDSEVLNSKVSDSFVDPSQIVGSEISVSEIIDSVVIDSTIKSSTITNMRVFNAVVENNYLKSGSIEFDGKTYTGPISLWEIQNPVLDASNVYIQGDKLIVNFKGLTVSDITSDSNADCMNKAESYSAKQGIKFELVEGKPRIVGSFNGWSTGDAIIGAVNGEQFIFDIDDYSLPDGDYSFYIKYSDEGSSCSGQWLYVKQSQEGLIRNINNTYAVVVRIINKMPSIPVNNPIIKTENVMKEWLDGSDLVIQGNKLVVKYSDKRVWYKDGLETKYDPRGKTIYFTGYFDGWQKLLPVIVEANGDIVLDVSVYPVGTVFGGSFVSVDNYWIGLSNNDPQNIRVENNSIYLIFEKTSSGVAKTTKQVDKTNQFISNKYWIDDSRISVSGQKLEIEANKNTFYKNNQEFVPDQLTGKQYFAAGPFDNWMRSRSLFLSGTKLVFDFTNEKPGVYAFAVETDKDEWLGMAGKNQDFARTEIEQDGNKSYWIVVEKKIVNGVPGLYKFAGIKIPREAFVFDIPYTNQPNFVPQEDTLISRKNIEYDGDLLFTIHFPDSVWFGSWGSQKTLNTMDRIFSFEGEFDARKNWIPVTKNGRSITLNFNGFPDGVYVGDIKTDQNEWLWYDGYTNPSPFVKLNVKNSAGAIGNHLVIVKEGNKLKPFDGSGASVLAVWGWVSTKPATANPDPIKYDLLNSYHAYLDNGEFVVKEWEDNKITYIKGSQKDEGVSFKNIPGKFILKIGYSTFWSPLEIPGTISGDKIVFNLKSESLPNGDYPANMVFRGSDGSEQWFWVQDSESRIVKNFDYYRMAFRVADNGNSILYADGSLSLDANKIKNIIPKAATQTATGNSGASGAPITFTRDSLNADYEFFKWAAFGVFTPSQMASFNYNGLSGNDGVKAYWEFARTNVKWFLDNIWEARKYDTGYVGQKSYKGNSCTIDSLFNDYNFYKWAYEKKYGSDPTKDYWNKYRDPNHSDWIGRSGVHLTVLDNMLKLWNPVSPKLDEYPSTCSSGSIISPESDSKTLVWTSSIEGSEHQFLGSSNDFEWFNEETETNGVLLKLIDLNDNCEADACLASFQTPLNNLDNGIIDELAEMMIKSGEKRRIFEVFGDDVIANGIFDKIKAGYKDIITPKNYKGGEMFKMPDGSNRGIRTEMSQLSKSKGSNAVIDIHNKKGVNMKFHFVSKSKITKTLWKYLKYGGRVVGVIGTIVAILEPKPVGENIPKIEFGYFKNSELVEDKIDMNKNPDSQQLDFLNPLLYFVLTEEKSNNGNIWYTAMTSYVMLDGGKSKVVRVGSGIWNIYLQKVNDEKEFAIENWYNYFPSSDEVLKSGYGYSEFTNIYTGKIGRIYHFSDGQEPIIVSGLNRESSDAFENDFVKNFKLSSNVESEVFFMESYINNQVVLASMGDDKYAIEMAKGAVKLMNDYRKTTNPVIKKQIQYAFYNIVIPELMKLKTVSTSAFARTFSSNALKGIARIAPSIFSKFMIFISPCPLDIYRQTGFCMYDQENINFI